jgi:hypothetical protein
MIARQEPSTGALEPGLSLVLLALGTVAIPAGMIGIVAQSAVRTIVNGAAEFRGPAADDVRDGTLVRTRHAFPDEELVGGPR